MAFPIALAAPLIASGASALFRPKEKPSFADEVDLKGKFEALFAQLQAESTGSGGALTEEEMAGIIQNLFDQAQPGLDATLSRSSSDAARRGIADSRLAAFNTSEAGRQFSLNTANQAQDLVKKNALSRFSGKQNALSSLTSLVSGLQGSRATGEQRSVDKGLRFDQGLGNLTNAATEFFSSANK